MRPRGCASVPGVAPVSRGRAGLAERAARVRNRLRRLAGGAAVHGRGARGRGGHGTVRGRAAARGGGAAAGSAARGNIPHEPAAPANRGRVEGRPRRDRRARSRGRRLRTAADPRHGRGTQGGTRVSHRGCRLDQQRAGGRAL